MTRTSARGPCRFGLPVVAILAIYAQHIGVPMPCFGDTSHFVTDVRPVE